MHRLWHDLDMHLPWSLWIVLVAACRGDGRTERTTPESRPASERAGSAPAASTGDAAQASPRTRADARLVAAPAEIGKQLALTTVVEGLARPVLLVVAPGDARRRWFVLEQHAGRVRIVEGGKLRPKPFLTIPGVSRGNEQGLLGLAFHPRFADNGKLYVNYTDKDDHTHIVEYRVSATNPDEVDPATRRELIKIDQPYSNHNGGHLVFGPDGKLWAGMGDGGAAGDPQSNGQNPKALLGKMLRFDVDAATAIPERVHVGVRNPWRFSFDAKTGDLMIADVGQNLWEYVFVVDGDDRRNHNFGWNVVEGSHCFQDESCDKSKFTLPVVEFSHQEGCSITGGFVYRGKALPELDGRYFYSDFCTSMLRSFRWEGGAVHEHWDWIKALPGASDLSQVSSFGVDHDGELYVVELSGAIKKLERRR